MSSGGGCWGEGREGRKKEREKVGVGWGGEDERKHETGLRRRNWKQMAHELNHDVEA